MPVQVIELLLRTAESVEPPVLARSLAVRCGVQDASVAASRKRRVPRCGARRPRHSAQRAAAVADALRAAATPRRRRPRSCASGSACTGRKRRPHSSRARSGYSAPAAGCWRAAAPTWTLRRWASRPAGAFMFTPEGNGLCVMRACVCARACAFAFVLTEARTRAWVCVCVCLCVSVCV
jgi:hypothetical protein